MQTKAICNLKLSAANDGKLAALDAVAGAYLQLAQRYVDGLIETESRAPDKYAPLPDVATALSERWQRCAWQQACGIVQSWFSNERTSPPVLAAWCIQANANVVVLEKSQTPTFDYWLRISTLDSGHPVRVPLRLYKNALSILAEYETLCSSVTLSKREGEWYATFAVKRHTRKAKAKQVVGVDIGMAAVVTTSEGDQYGLFGQEVRERLAKTDAKRQRKQKLNACLTKKGLPTVDLHDHRAEAFVRNGIGQALNQMLNALPQDTAVALEKLNVADMRFLSRQMNRLLKASQLGFIRDRLKFKLDERAIRYRSVQPAYSSQQCAQCGFTFSLNRPSQATFRCLWCGHQAHADVNAAVNIAERFGDAQLNALSFRQVETVLVVRFLRRLSDACSASAEQDTLATVVSDPTQLVNLLGQALPRHKCG